jgi:ADP-ribosyl-[dinitrogen reductase] hydrolase
MRFDAKDQMQRYVRWWKEGHLSCTGGCFDIGNATSSALARFARTGQPLSGSTNPNSAGNGSIMRLAPVPMFYAGNPQRAMEFAAESSRTTHGATAAVDACRYFAALLVGALGGASKEELLSDHYSPVKAYWESHSLVDEIREIAAGSFRRKEPPAIIGSGYVVRSLEAALWAFHKSKDYREGCLMAANLGNDADTTAAVYGQLAGAFYGEDGIPQEWLGKLAMRETIATFANQLYTLSQKEKAQPDLRESSAFHAEIWKIGEGSDIPAPSARSYWVVPSKLLAGTYPGDPNPDVAKEKLSVLVAAGIRCFIDLTSPEDTNMAGQPLIPYIEQTTYTPDGSIKITYHRKTITDLDIPSLAEMKEILDIIDGAILNNLPVYVHCLGGIGRTGTVVGCWLARHGIESGQSILDMIRRLRRNDSQSHRASPETAEQRRFILDWEEGE